MKWILRLRKHDIISVVVGTALGIAVWVCVVGPVV